MTTSFQHETYGQTQMVGKPVRNKDYVCEISFKLNIKNNKIRGERERGMCN